MHRNCTTNLISDSAALFTFWFPFRRSHSFWPGYGREKTFNAYQELNNLSQMLIKQKRCGFSQGKKNMKSYRKFLQKIYLDIRLKFEEAF